MNKLTGLEALARLRKGNERFVADLRGAGSPGALNRQHVLTRRKWPYAIILGCSDARVPAEIVFDQGLGDLFVIRVAGNVVALSQVGSVEFAAERFGIRLVVVLGHTRCGAIEATIEELAAPGGNGSPNVASIVDRIRPVVAQLLETPLASDPDGLRHHAVRANVRAAADHLRHGSRVLEELILGDGLLVVGAEYSVETGEVVFFDGVPAGA